MMNPASLRLGLPTPAQLTEFRIWDSYFTPSHSHPGADGSSRLLPEIERALPAIEKGRFEKLCYFPHVGIGTTTDKELEKKLRLDSELVLTPLRRWPKLLLGMIQINANDVPASLAALDRWLREQVCLSFLVHNRFCPADPIRRGGVGQHRCRGPVHLSPVGVPHLEELLFRIEMYRGVTGATFFPWPVLDQDRILRVFCWLIEDLRESFQAGNQVVVDKQLLPVTNIAHITFIKEEEAEGEEAEVDADGEEPEIIGEKKGEEEAAPPAEKEGSGEAEG